MRAKEIADFLQADLRGGDCDIKRPCSLDDIHEHGLVFLHRSNEDAVRRINATPHVMALVTESTNTELQCAHVSVKNARLAFAKVVTRYFGPAVERPRVADTAVVGRNVILGKDVSIGEYTIIEDNVRIGDRTQIRHHVVVAAGSIIGTDCLVMSHCVIGEEGFGFIHDERDTPLRFPHIGCTEIGDRVEIGNFNAIPRAALGKTLVGSDTKTGDFVQIPHNARVGRYCLLAAYAKVGSGATIEDHVFLGVRSSTRENVRVGAWALVGQGSVVLEDIQPKAVVAGVPARYLRDRGKEGGF